MDRLAKYTEKYYNLNFVSQQGERSSSRVSMRDSRISSEVAEVIANQISRRKTLPYSDEPISNGDTDLHDKQLVYSRRTVL